MTHGTDSRSAVNITELSNKRFYVLDRNIPRSWDRFRLLHNGTHSYYTFRRSCEMSRKVRRLAHMCATIEVDNQRVGVIHNLDFDRTHPIDITIAKDPRNPHSNSTIYFMPQFDMNRFNFQIISIDQTKKRLVAQVYTMPVDAYVFNVDIAEEIDDKETELILILCITANEMRDFITTEQDDKEDFYSINNK